MEAETGFLMDQPTWAQRVKTVRNRLNLTQEAFAEMLGVHINTIPLWETREQRPYSEAAEKFMELELEVLADGGVS